MAILVNIPLNYLKIKGRAAAILNLKILHFSLKKHKNNSFLLLLNENWTFWLKNVETDKGPFGSSVIP
jgi:hypothetical protein